MDLISAARFAALAVVISATSASLPANAADMPSFEAPVPVAADTPGQEPGWSHEHPAMATDGSGTWIVAWDSNDSFYGTIGNDADILFARSTNHGLSFSAAQPLNPMAAVDYSNGVHGDDDESPSLAADANGHWVAVWTTGFSVRSARSSDGGQTWNSDTNSVMQGEYASVATDGHGAWVIVATDRTGYQRAHAWFTRSTDNGATWSTRQLIDPSVASNDEENAYLPRVVCSSTVCLASWTIGDMLTGSQLLCARSTDAGVSWSAPISLYSSPPGSPMFGFGADFANDSAGNWITVWTVIGGFTGTVHSARSTDDGMTWSGAQRIDPLDGDYETLPRIASGPAGTVMAVWQRGDVESDVAGATSDDGGQTWSTASAVNATAATDSAVSYREDLDWQPIVGFDPAGHWLAVWTSNNTFDGATGDAKRMVPVMAMTGLLCGNGVLDPGEQCDDGLVRRDGDCCSRACTFDAPATRCEPDADLCTADQCDGGGLCLHSNAPRVDCLPAPGAGASLRVLPSKDELRWNWQGEDKATFWRFGRPDCVDSYALCVYDASPSLIARADVAAGDRCSSMPDDLRWKSMASGSFRFQDPAADDGFSRIALRTDAKSQTNLKANARGPVFTLPGLPVANLPVTVQLVNSGNSCWEAEFTTTKRNDAGGFSAKSD